MNGSETGQRSSKGSQRTFCCGNGRTSLDMMMHEDIPLCPLHHADQSGGTRGTQRVPNGRKIGGLFTSKDFDFAIVVAEVDGRPQVRWEMLNEM